MAKIFRYQHLRSLVPDVEPSIDIIREGEIAVNLYAGKERMFLKNTNNRIVRFITEEQIDAKIASGSSAHAEGSNTTASGSQSHAEGNNTVASGQFSHAEGHSRGLR